MVSLVKALMTTEASEASYRLTIWRSRHARPGQSRRTPRFEGAPCKAPPTWSAVSRSAVGSPAERLARARSTGLFAFQLARLRHDVLGRDCRRLNIIATATVDGHLKVMGIKLHPEMGKVVGIGRHPFEQQNLIAAEFRERCASRSHLVPRNANELQVGPQDQCLGRSSAKRIGQWNSLKSPSARDAEQAVHGARCSSDAVVVAV